MDNKKAESIRDFQDRYLAVIGNLNSRAFIDSVDIRSHTDIELHDWARKIKRTLTEIVEKAQEGICLLEEIERR